MYDSPALPQHMDFISPKLAVLMAVCLALLAVGATLLVVTNPPGNWAAHLKVPCEWSLAAALTITLAELSVFLYYNQLVRGIKGLPAVSPDTKGIGSNKPYRKDYQFRPETVGFFSPKIPVWERVLEKYKGKPDLQYLEVGLFEGRAALWMLENVLTHPTARLRGIDPFFDSGESGGPSYEDVFYSNLKMSRLAEKTVITKGFSQIELRKLPLASFDIIYIDGSHDIADCLEDAVISFRLLREGGTLIFDDYSLGAKTYSTGDKPRLAVDTFFAFFSNHFEIVYSNAQVILRMKAMPRLSPFA